MEFVHGSRHTLAQGASCAMHFHSSIEIVYHPLGRGITRMDEGCTISFDEGSALIYAPNERHDQVLDIEGEDLCVKIAAPPGSLSLPKRCLHLPAVKSPALIEDIHMLTRGHVQLAPMEQAILNLRATSLLLALVHQACTWTNEDKQNSSLTYVLKAEQHIRENFASIESMQQIADHVGISHDHLRHTFRSLRTKSMVSYLNEIRIDRAKNLLVHTLLPLKQVATMCGFKDPYYFSTVFKSIARTSPGRYRNQ